MAQPDPPGDRVASNAPAHGPALLALAPSVYRVARRLTEGVDDAAAVTRDAVSSVAVAPAAGTALRARTYRDLWLALQALWAQRGALHTEDVPASADELLAELATFDEGELDRRLMSRLDASPEVDLALRRLTASERFAVLLIDTEDVTREDAAAALDVSVDEISALLLHARARIFASLVDDVPLMTGPAAETGAHAEAHPALLVLQDVLDHLVARDARVRVDDHLAACAVCRRQLHALRWTVVRLAGAGAGLPVPLALQRELGQLIGAAAPLARTPEVSEPLATGGSRWRQVTRWFTSS